MLQTSPTWNACQGEGTRHRGECTKPLSAVDMQISPLRDDELPHSRLFQGGAMAHIQQPYLGVPLHNCTGGTGKFTHQAVCVLVKCRRFLIWKSEGTDNIYRLDYS